MIKAVVAGVAGRMGRCVSGIINSTDGIELAGGTESTASEFMGRDIGDILSSSPKGLKVASSLREAVEARGGNMAIDFTTPESTMRNLKAALELKIGMVIGTTGMEPEETNKIRDAAQTIPILFAPNMSVGINLMLRLVCEAASVLGEEYDIEIVEAHHRLKKDAPSGTAVKLAEVLAETTGKDWDSDVVLTRKGMIGERKKGSIGVQTLRGGDIVGDHTVLFCGDGERLEITHRASSRETFARGAVRAALWLDGKAPGLYTMRNVLGF